MELFLWLLAGHFIGDFAFQSAWMASEKGKSWEINFYHAAVYTAAVMFFGTFGVLAGAAMRFMLYGTPGDISFLVAAPAAIIVIFISHFFIDPLKTRYGLIRYIWEKQLLHMVILAMIVLLKPYDQLMGLGMFFLVLGAWAWAVGEARSFLLKPSKKTQ